MAGYLKLRPFLLSLVLIFVMACGQSTALGPIDVQPVASDSSELVALTLAELASRRLLAASAARLLADSNPSYLHHNHLRNVTLATGESRTVQGRREFASNGEVASEVGYVDGYGFTGQERDASTDLIHFKWRYLDTSAVRWASPDPLFGQIGGNIMRLGESTTAYAYVANNGLNYIDPTGLGLIQKFKQWKIRRGGNRAVRMGAAAAAKQGDLVTANPYFKPGNKASAVTKLTYRGDTNQKLRSMEPDRNGERVNMLTPQEVQSGSEKIRWYPVQLGSTVTELFTGCALCIKQEAGGVSVAHINVNQKIDNPSAEYARIASQVGEAGGSTYQSDNQAVASVVIDRNGSNISVYMNLAPAVPDQPQQNNIQVGSSAIAMTAQTLDFPL